MLVLQDHESVQDKFQLAQNSAAEQQELWPVDTQSGLKDAHTMIDFLTAELDDVMRARSEHYSKFTRQLEYLTRVITPLTGVVNEKQQQKHCCSAVRHPRHNAVLHCNGTAVSKAMESKICCSFAQFEHFVRRKMFTLACIMTCGGVGEGCRAEDSR